MMVAGQGSDQDKVRRQRGTSLHHQVALALGNHIRSDVYRPGEALPAEPELCRQFNVSRVTIRTALATLEHEGLIHRRQGVGTFVEKGAQMAPVLRAPMSEMLAHIEDVEHRTKVRLLDFDQQRPPNHVRVFFEAEPEEALHRLLRLRFWNGQPLFHVETYVPQWLGQQIRKSDLETRAFYRILQEMGVSLASGEQVVSATIATSDVAGRLETSIGAPLLQVRRYHRDAIGRPVQYVEFLSSPSVYEMRMELQGRNPP